VFLFNKLLSPAHQGAELAIPSRAVFIGIPLRGEFFALLTMSRLTQVYYAVDDRIFSKIEINLIVVNNAPHFIERYAVAAAATPSVGATLGAEDPTSLSMEELSETAGDGPSPAQ